MAERPDAFRETYEDPPYVNQKYQEAVADAVEKGADDTKGRTCYICMEGSEEEGLVRGCACRGENGFVHMSCLVRAAEVAEESHNLASSFISLERFAEAKSLLRDMMPVAQRVLRENDDIPSRLKWLYAKALYKDDGATADDLREAIQTLEDAEPIARRVLGGSHPLVAWIEQSLLDSRAFLVAREKSSDEEKDSESK